MLHRKLLSTVTDVIAVLISYRFSFGDCRYPSIESAALIEEITRQQMSEVVREPKPESLELLSFLEGRYELAMFYTFSFSA